MRDLVFFYFISTQTVESEFEKEKKKDLNHNSFHYIINTLKW